MLSCRNAQLDDFERLVAAADAEFERAGHAALGPGPPAQGHRIS
jgi:hypothetical protein